MHTPPYHTKPSPTYSPVNVNGSLLGGVFWRHQPTAENNKFHSSELFLINWYLFSPFMEAFANVLNWCPSTCVWRTELTGKVPQYLTFSCWSFVFVLITSTTQKCLKVQGLEILSIETAVQMHDSFLKTCCILWLCSNIWALLSCGDKSTPAASTNDCDLGQCQYLTTPCC